MTLEEELRRRFDRDRGPEIEEEHGGDDEPNVRPLVGQDDGVESKAAVSRAVLRSLPDDAEVVDEQRPNHGCENRIEGEPHEWVAEMMEREDLDESAGEIEEIVDEFEGPTDQGEGVNAGPRPEEQDDNE